MSFLSGSTWQMWVESSEFLLCLHLPCDFLAHPELVQLLGPFCPDAVVTLIAVKCFCVSRFCPVGADPSVRPLLPWWCWNMRLFREDCSAVRCSLTGVWVAKEPSPASLTLSCWLENGHQPSCPSVWERPGMRRAQQEDTSHKSPGGRWPELLHMS